MLEQGTERLHYSNELDFGRPWAPYGLLSVSSPNETNSMVFCAFVYLVNLSEKRNKPVVRCVKCEVSLLLSSGLDNLVVKSLLTVFCNV